MNGAPDGSRRAEQLYNPSTITDMQNSRLVIAGDQPIELQGPRREAYNTPSPSTAEGVSPPSSKNRGQLRAASRGIVSPGGKGFSDHHCPSFGAGVRNVPSPILTNNQPWPVVTVDQHQMRGNFPEIQIQFVGGMQHGPDRLLEPQQKYFPDYASNEIPQIAPGAFHLEHQPNGRPMHDQILSVENPYAERADEIGPSHDIPGIWHLDGLLTPPGWKEGDEPIDPQAAQRLFQAARVQAKNSLMTDFGETQHLGPEEQVKRKADLSLQWNSSYRLDRTLYEERVNVYQNYQKRKQLEHQPRYEQQQDFTQSIALEPPHSINPPTMTTYAINYNPQLPVQPDLHRELTEVDASYFAQSRTGDRSIPAPSSGTISPTNLDPALVPQTRKAIHRQHEAWRAGNQRGNKGNDRNLKSWLSTDGPHPLDPQLTAGMPPPFTNQPARHFYSSHNGSGSSVSGDQRVTSDPRPRQYVSPTRGQFNGASGSFQYPTESPYMESSQPDGNQRGGVPGFLMPRERGKNQASCPTIILGNGHHIRNEPETSIDEAKGSKGDSPKRRRKRVAKEKVEKSKPWYADHINDVQLPTSVISDEAIQAGRDYDPNGNKIEKIPKSSPARRRRGGKLAFDPYVGIPISDEAAELLIASGAPDRRNRPASVPVPVYSGVTPFRVSPVPHGLSAHSELYNPSPVEQSNFVFSRNAQPEVSPESGVSSDLSDDHKDGDYGRKATSRHSTARTTQNIPRSNNKRKAVDAVEANKRGRYNMDGHNDTFDPFVDGNYGLGA